MKAEAWARAHKGLIALLAAAAAGVGVLLFLLHPKGQQAAQSAISYIPSQFGATGAGSTSDTSIPGASTSASSAATGMFGLTENQPAGFPTGGSGTIPLWADPNNLGAKLLDWLPWNAQVQIIGAPVIGRAAGGGSTTWYPVEWGGQTGWVNSEAFQSYIGTPPVGGVNLGPTAGPDISLKQTLSNVPQSSAVMGGVG